MNHADSHSEGSSTEPVGPIPVVLYACVHNSGRSVAAKVLTEHYATGRVEVRSAGSLPGTSVNPEVAAVLADRGLTTDAEVPTRLTTGLVQTADVVVTMGCGETCPIFPGKRYTDWGVEDPAGQGRAVVERIVDDIDRRVRELLFELGIDVPGRRQNPAEDRSQRLPTANASWVPTTGTDGV